MIVNILCFRLYPKDFYITKTAANQLKATKFNKLFWFFIQIFLCKYIKH